MSLQIPRYVLIFTYIRTFQVFDLIRKNDFGLKCEPELPNHGATIINFQKKPYALLITYYKFVIMLLICLAICRDQY